MHGSSSERRYDDLRDQRIAIKPFPIFSISFPSIHHQNRLISVHRICMDMPPKTRTIRQKVIISASPEDVYDAFMDPKKHAAFTGGEASGSSKVGGEFSAWDGYITAKNLDLKNGQKIVQ